MHGFPHEKREVRTHGRCPGNGVTPALLSREPLATEGEATPGPDDHNPYLEREAKAEIATQLGHPTRGPDPYVFDDVGDEVADVDLPALGRERPSFSFPDF